MQLVPLQILVCGFTITTYHHGKLKSPHTVFFFQELLSWQPQNKLRLRIKCSFEHSAIEKNCYENQYLERVRIMQNMQKPRRFLLSQRSNNFLQFKFALIEKSCTIQSVCEMNWVVPPPSTQIFFAGFVLAKEEPEKHFGEPFFRKMENYPNAISDRSTPSQFTPSLSSY